MPRTPYQRLGDAQEAAAKAGMPAPCTEAPKLWTSDLLSRHQLLELIHACRECPVLDLCKQYRDDSHKRGRPLTGVVAGELYSMGQNITKTALRQQPRDPLEGHRLGRVSLAQALAWFQNGLTQAEVGRAAGVSTSSVANAFLRLRIRIERRRAA